MVPTKELHHSSESGEARAVVRVCNAILEVNAGGECRPTSIFAIRSMIPASAMPQAYYPRDFGTSARRTALETERF